jgi:NRAMP (natural resistance-associated macrophage protein)-like metal ion transporter
MDARNEAGLGSSRSPARLLKHLGPGLISGASDDDPTAIATYSQAGAGFGYALSWMPVFCLPIMATVQEISARVGRATGHGLAGIISRQFPSWLVITSVLLLLLANVIAIGADLGAMADVIQHAIGGERLLYVVLLGALCVVLEILMPYERYVAVLKWTTLSLLGYVAAALATPVAWGDVAYGLVPDFSNARQWITTLVAIFGAAISPYVFFWQSAQESETFQSNRRRPVAREPELASAEIRRIRLDTYAGMTAAMLVGLAIIITTAANLHAAGVTQIESSAQVAEALRPAAGPFAFALFALGLIGTGLLAIPVLAGSAAYAIGESLQWPVGLTRRPSEAKAFYATIAAAAALGVALNVAEIDPMQALFWSAVINGVVAVPMLALMTTIAARRSVMGEMVIGRPLHVIGWVAVGIMGTSVAAMVLTSIW